MADEIFGAFSVPMKDGARRRVTGYDEGVTGTLARDMDRLRGGFAEPRRASPLDGVKVRPQDLSPIPPALRRDAPRPRAPKPLTVPMKDGTRATVKSVDVPDTWFGGLLPEAITKHTPDHMFVEYDDGANQYIYRGGPQVSGWRWPTLHAQVDRARQSPDYEKGERIISERFLPWTTAEQAIVPARQHAAEVNGLRRPYLGLNDNSNTVISDLARRQYGKVEGDRTTWGHLPPPPPRLPIY